MIVSADGRLYGSHRVESPAGEWPGRRYSPYGLSLDVLLIGEELAPGTSSDDVSGIGQGHVLVEA